MKTIAVYHNKGGVGKTTTVINLAAALRKMGYRVLIVDLDSQANTTFATGLIKFEDEEFDNIRESNVLHVLESEDFYSIEEVARRSSYCDPEVDVVPSHIDLMSQENDLNQKEYSKMILLEKLAEVANKYDFVLIDTPPSLNLYARVALIAADYLIIPSDLKPFANQGLKNVKEFIKGIDRFRKQTGRRSIQTVGILASKISTNYRFGQSTLPIRIAAVPERYGFDVLETVIFDREDLAKCSEATQAVGELEIPDPRSVLDYKPGSQAAMEFEALAEEVLRKVGAVK